MIYCECVFLNSQAFAPVYKTKEAACADVAVPKAVTIAPGEIKRVPLSIGFKIPSGYKIIMYPRSSLLIKHSLMSPTSIVDADYSGQEVHWPVINLGKEPVILDYGTRVAQIECVPVYDCQSWVHERTERNKENGGFGSTGV